MNIRLARGKALPVHSGEGRTIRALEGRVWITEERGGDIVLEAGESFRLARPGLTVIEAFSDAAISIN